MRWPLSCAGFSKKSATIPVSSMVWATPSHTLSDPRAVVLKQNARSLAEKDRPSEEFQLLEAVERLTPQVFAEITGNERAICANVDLYSGLVYQMMNIPPGCSRRSLPSRVSGWCAHRIEEVMTGGRIIRPAYKSVAPKQLYVPMTQRQ